MRIKTSKEINRDYYLRNRKRVLARNTAWNKAHPSNRRAAAARWRRKFPSKNKVAYKSWRLNNIAHRKAYMRNWIRANPHRNRHYAAKRRAATRANRCDQALLAFVDRLKRRRRIQCYYCPTILPFREGHIEHIRALSQGGEHAADNICFACPPCNLSKHTARVGDWQPPVQQPLLAI